ncbi:hypothetical protein CONPUDRAFT_169396 [Coniophora puteana RWD-64-598 SS2]|uniref:Uncharacterized protein n=1 Tax=Coniophora puteana (strain RWD-64-598) TaxID=741705 RepID=A0A5M3MAF1_CONPW|nr:uncharacterized protein CONPUDRAFT_169396 [Coniophora puteana RWD-64-598 SS2]EIW75605.1 hypothetical protein CONPUDRAFT_169396 [Coniophora puteana RWD-64-598 SS2]
MSLTLTSIPEELLARILALAVTAQPTLTPRPAWSTPPNHTPGAPVRTRLAPLLVNRAFLRIASPAFYRTVLLRTPQHASDAARALQAHPELLPAVRAIITGGVWTEAGALLSLCPRVDTLDICLDAGVVLRTGPANTSAPQRAEQTSEDDEDEDAKAFCDVIEGLDLRSVIIRKASSAYLTHAKPKYVLSRLARAVLCWKNLERADLCLKLSGDAPSRALGDALAHAPRLHTLRAQLPALWNDVVLRASDAPALERVVLYTAPAGGHLAPADGAVLATGMYISEARKHARLGALIKAGTSMIRTRAHTLDMSGMATSLPSLDAFAASVASSSSRSLGSSSSLPSLEELSGLGKGRPTLSLTPPAGAPVWGEHGLRSPATEPSMSPIAEDAWL